MSETDPPLLSLDIETYGSCERATNGDLLPPQTVFHPSKSLYLDGVSPQHLVLTCALTLVHGDPMTPHEWVPGDTMVLDLSKEMHRECLCRWLDHSTHLLGANIQFDILYLRRFDPSFRMRLGGRHTLIDLPVLNYLHSEFREGSLKSLGETLGTHAYAETLKDGHRFKTPHDPKFLQYAAADTHNTVLAAAELGKRTKKDWPKTDKGSVGCLEWYSKTLWTVLRMSEAGVPLSLELLDDLGDQTAATATTTAQSALEDFGLLLEGAGSSASKADFITRCLALAPEILDHPMLELTPKTKQVSWSSGNRQLIKRHLPVDSPELEALDLAEQYANSQKLLSTYLWPLVHHRRNEPSDRRSVLIPWFPIPTNQQTSTSTSAPTPSVSSGTKDSRKRSEPSTTSETSSSKQQLLFNLTSSPLICLEDVRIPQPIQISAPSRTLSSSSTGSWQRRLKTPAARSSSPSRNSSRSTGAVYPTWYVVPGRFKESEDSGGTVQARITCKQPSAQTFPPSIKEAITSRWTNGSIIWFDLSQVEMRVAAILSKDKTLIKSFNEGLDLHTDRTTQLFGPSVLEDKDFNNTWRQVGKTINFADLFLASPQRMQQSAWEMTGRLINLSVFEKAVRDRPRVRPGLWNWQQSLIEEVDRTGTLHIPHTGQSRTFVGGSKGNINTIVNFPVQTTAANVTLAIQHELTSILGVDDLNPTPKILMCLQIYDSVCLDVPAGKEQKALDAIKEAVDRVSQPQGYWGRIELESGVFVPLDYKTS
jgi:hypothetical protein